MKRARRKTKSFPRKRSTKSHPIDYRLLITPRYDERTKRTLMHFALRTIKEFVNFRYEIVLSHRFTDRTIQLDIEGLRAPELTLPASGPAEAVLEFDNLAGKYTIVITKLAKETNVFRVAIDERKVVVEDEPKEKFIEIVTSPEDW